MKKGWLKRWARGFKEQTLIVWFAARDPRTPWIVRLLALAVAAYAVSPIDLIPDFIPFIGYLDDLIILPLAIALIVRLVPEDVLLEARTKAAAMTRRPTSRAAMVIIVLIWLVLLALVARWVVGMVGN
jgi:uncharacterized membrane protein YkvA (DUF1232 family)